MATEERRATKAAAARRERQAWVKAGLCMLCGKVPARMRRRTCQDCADRVLAAEQKRRAERRAAGLCIACGEHPAEERDRCKGCSEKRRAFPSYGRNATRKARQRDGLCIECGEPKRGEAYVRCEECRKATSLKQQQRRLERLARGLCQCGRKVVTGYTKCRSCRSRAKQEWEDRKEMSRAA